MAKKLVTFYKINDVDLNHLAIKEGQLIITEDTQRAYLDITDEDRIEIEDYDLEFDSSNRYKLVFKYPDGTGKVLYVTGVVRNISTGNTNGTILVDKDGVLGEVPVAGLQSLAFKSEISTNEITSGVLPVARGGSGQGTFTSGEVLIGSGTAAFRTKPIDTTAGGTDQSADLISSGAVKAGLDEKVPLSQKGIAGGVASLDNTGKVPAAQLPSFVDDVIEFPTRSDFPVTGESGKIYVALDTNLTYRWSGSAYVEISPSLALGETSTTAYRGDRGKIAYDHATEKGNAYVSDLYQMTTNAEGHVTAAAAMTVADFESKYNIRPITIVDLNYDGTTSHTRDEIMALVTAGHTIIGKWAKSSNNYLYVPLLKGDTRVAFGFVMPMNAPQGYSNKMISVVLEVASSGKTYSKSTVNHGEEAVFIAINSIDIANNAFTVSMTDSEGHSISDVAVLESFAHTKEIYLSYTNINTATQEATSFFVPYSHGENLTAGDKVTFATVGNLNLTDEVATGIYYYEFVLTGPSATWYSEGTITRKQLNGNEIVNVQSNSTTNAYSCNYTEQHFQHQVLYGFTEPLASQGVDGDIYLMLDDNPI